MNDTRHSAALDDWDWSGLSRLSESDRAAAQTGGLPEGQRAISAAQQSAIDALLGQAKAALDADDRANAHRLLQQAVQIDPYDERIWWGLLRTVDAFDDQRVALENIIAINPFNVKARERLRYLHEAREKSEQRQQMDALVAAEQRRERHRRARRRFGRFVRRMVMAVVIGGILGTFFSVLVYGLQVQVLLQQLARILAG
jgi:hypothetical protein